MPRVYRKRSRTRTRKAGPKRRKYRRVSRRRGSIRRRPRAGIPYSKTVKLVYLDQATHAITVSGSSFAFRQYRLNSAYDFDIQYFSDSAVGYNEWAAFYKRYLVTHITLSVTFLNTNAFPVWVGMYFRPVRGEVGWTSWSTWRNLSGQRGNGKQVFLSQAGGKLDRVTITMSMPCWKIFGNKKQYYGDEDFSSSVTLNPGGILDGLIYVLTPTGGSAVNAFDVWTQIKATQHVRFYQPKTLDISNTFDAADPGGEPAETTVVNFQGP